MITEKNSISALLEELSSIEGTEQYRIAREVSRLSAMLSERILDARRQYREGQRLMESGVTLQLVREIAKHLEEGDKYDAC